ncbi:type IV secretion system DNA-binding domain-containing protein [Aurantimonas sp. C2-6-R+9]|uniref:type IV secretion system DNA-binding domain-containing protein n=1 Tax=unclassified Aurantimonas TaxID=2638230 RepID=UPI002E177733|nr:type IV secretion system DNA-binding domain-containing protein [Aurantimonas sp. C2-6-R+9]
MIKKHKPYPPYWWGFAALGAGLVATLVLWWFNFAGTYWRLWDGQILEMRPWPALFCLRPWDVLTCHGIFETAGYPDMMKIYRRQVTVFLPIILGIAALFATWYYRNKPRRQYVLEGPSIGDRDDLRKACERDWKSGKGEGLHVFDTLTLSRDREANNLGLFGAPGSGKTQVILQLCRNALSRGDGAIVYCQKSEMVSSYPRHFEGGVEQNPIIVGPHDYRSWVWDIAADVDGPESARTLADRIINLNRDDQHFFSDTSRLVVTMYIAKLHAVSPHAWSFADLVAQVERPYDDMVKDARRYYTPAVQLLTSEKRQLDSIRSSVQVALENLRLLAVAWPTKKEGDDRKFFSIRKFINGEYPEKSVLVARSGDFPQMSEMWIVLFFSLAQQAASSDSMKASNTRRVWFILDEFAQLPKMKAISQLMVTGRERGFPMVLGLQSMRQVNETYGPNEFDTWWSSIQTKIIFRSEVGEITSWFAEKLGKTRLLEYKLEKNADGTTDTKSKERSDSPFRSEEFGHLLGKREDGIDVHVSGIGMDHYLVRAPFYEKTASPVFRDAYEPADWIKAPRPSAEDLPKAMPEKSVALEEAARARTPSPVEPGVISHIQTVDRQGNIGASSNAAIPSAEPVPTGYSAENIEVLKGLSPAKRRSSLYTSDPVEDDIEVSEVDDEAKRKAAKNG